jgi:glycosyltransferase involved in cell wall biosynthesis
MCLTKDRRDFLPQAIACFQASTYGNREMLILNSGCPVSDLVPADAQIKLVRASSGSPLGALRNEAVKLAQGEVIAHWDDDDYSAPGRLMDQVVRLMDSDKQVTGYNSMMFESESERWMFTALSNYAIGTSLMYRKDYALENPFLAIQVAEDGFFSNQARDTNSIACAPADGLMRASIHPGNTSPRCLKGDNWKFVGTR